MTPEREEIFNDGVLERLARANRDYLNTHGEYIVPLAEMLLEARRQLAEKDEALRAIAEPARTEWLPGEYPLVIARMMELAREALRAEPAKEEA